MAHRAKSPPRLAASPGTRRRATPRQLGHRRRGGWEVKKWKKAATHRASRILLSYVQKTDYPTWAVLYGSAHLIREALLLYEEAVKCELCEDATADRRAP